MYSVCTYFIYVPAATQRCRDAEHAEAPRPLAAPARGGARVPRGGGGQRPARGQRAAGGAQLAGRRRACGLGDRHDDASACARYPSPGKQNQYILAWCCFVFFTNVCCGFPHVVSLHRFEHLTSCVVYREYNPEHVFKSRDYGIFDALSRDTGAMWFLIKLK